MICIVSPHEKGFWQADVYFDGWMEGITADWFCTGSIGGTKESIIEKVRGQFPQSKIIDGITGVCLDCGAEHFLLEDECRDCGGFVDDE